jgi:hypothetical protein
MATKFSLDKSFKVYNDNTGDFVTVRKDPDGFLLEIEQSENGQVVMFPPEQARLVVSAVLELLKDFEQQDK